MRSADATMTSTLCRVSERTPHIRQGHKYLDRSTVNEKAVHFVEGLAGAIGVVEGNVGNTSADTSWAV
jgi:hypothetical protein